MMRKYIQWMSLFLLALFATSCERDIVSGMDGSVDQRIDNLIKGYVNQLQSSQYGWMASVYTQNGYYQFWMSFPKGDTVVMYTDNPGYKAYKQIPDTATYTFRALQRPTLSFDTYSYISYINDPDPNISGAATTDYTGLKTDFEFEVDSVKGDMFYFTGLINRAKAVFRKATAEDFTGVQAGLMTDLPDSVAKAMQYYNVYSSYNGTEIIVKISGNRRLYTFWYNDSKLAGVEGGSYFNVEVNGTGDLFFPEQIITPNITLTGLKYDNAKQQYVGFYTDKGAVLDATVSYDVPSYSLTKLFGYKGSGKLFTTLQYENNLAANIGGTTNSSFNFLGKLLQLGIIAFACDVHYNLQVVYGTPQLALYFQPTNAIGADIYSGQLTAAFPASTYTYPITVLSSDSLTFSTSGDVSIDAPGLIYYNGNATKELVDNFKNKTFKLDWSTQCRSSSVLVVQLFPQGAPTGAFTPPSLLAK
jgi:hypothetical protein